MVYNEGRLAYYTGQGRLSFVNPEKAKGRREEKGGKKRKEGKRDCTYGCLYFPYSDYGNIRS